MTDQMVYVFESNAENPQITLDFSDLTGTIPHASRLTPHASRRSSSHADNTDQTSEVSENLGGLQHYKCPDFCLLPFKPVQSACPERSRRAVEEGRIEGMGYFFKRRFSGWIPEERRFYVRGLSGK